MNILIENRDSYKENIAVTTLFKDFEDAIVQEDAFKLAFILNKLKDHGIEIVIKEDEKDIVQ